MKAHWHILGGTGKGKTKFLEHITKSLMQQEQGLCVIDPHGDLYDELVAYITRHRLEHKVILIDPNEDEWIVGLNYLELFEGEGKGVHDRVSLVLRAFMKVFGEIDEGAKPRFERWGRDALHVLTESGQTLVETRDFLGINNKAVRDSILGQVKDEFYLKEWYDFENYNQRDKLNMLESVYNRLNKFIGHERIRRIVGQAKSTVNFRQAMDEGKIILVNLAPRKFSQEIKNMLGVMMIDMIVEAAISRNNIPEKKRKPFYLIVDEFGEIVCDDFAYALDSCRKYKVWLILAHQRLYQLQKDNPNVYDAVMNHADIKISFGISRDNAEIMAKELFTGKITGNKIKDEIFQTKFWPKETTRTVSGESHGSSDSSGTGTSSSTGFVNSSGSSQTLDPNSGLFFHQVVGLTDSSSQAYSRGSADSSFDSITHSDTYSKSTVPWYEYEPFQELSSRTYYTPEELLEKYIAWIKNQTPRHAQLKTGTKGPMAIVTPWMEDTRVRAKDVAQSRQLILSKCATKVTEVDRQLIDRQHILLGKPKLKRLELDNTEIEEIEFEEVPAKPEAKDIISKKDYRE